MSCARAREIDIEAFLVDPRAEEHREFREHYPGCRACSEEVAGWTAFEGVLVEGTGADAHPADELLLAYHRAPGSLAVAQRDELAGHLEGCGPCRDALGALGGLDLERLLAQPAESAHASAPAGEGLWAQLAERLRGLFELPAPAWAAIAVVVALLAIGLPRLLGEEAAPPLPLAQREEPVAPRPTPPVTAPEAPAPSQQLAEVPEPPAPSEVPEDTAPVEEERIAETPPPVEEERIAEAPPPAPEEPSEALPSAPPAEEIVEVTPPAPEVPPAQPPKPEPSPPPAASGKLIVALGAEPLRFLPRVGLPAGRITGGTRGASVGRARPLALTPERVGLTLEPQPSLYWFLPAPSAVGVRIDVSDLDAMKTVLSTVVRGPLAAGVHVLRLGAHGLRLARDHNYQWMLTPVGADAPASGGIVRQVASDAALRASLSNAAPAERLRLLAAAGVWHDAFDLLSRSIAARPADAQLRQARADLLEQQGLPDAAAWDRAAR